ncbi:MAG TPA: T9SS type A sorting domain-containing protein [Bacteroidetes bacterium]|nr:T9SS type A sorting domain-containing protein [Bacteroidota bacterium]
MLCMCIFMNRIFLTNLKYLFFLFVFLTGERTIVYGQKRVEDFLQDIIINTSDNPAPGYFFLAVSVPSSYLAIIDNQGVPVFYRRMEYPVMNLMLQEDGRLTFLSWETDYVYFMNDLLQLTDSVTTVGYGLDPHDYAITKDGHVLLLGADKEHVDMSKVVPGGDPNATIKEGVVQEFDENKHLLYTWKTSEHFRVTDGDEESAYVNLTAGVVDYCHLNAIAVDSDTSFLISSRHMDEITKVDRRTGEIIWRLGGEHNMFTFINDSIGFCHQHSIRKLSNGHILLFDNGNLHDPPVSSAVEYAVDEKKMTATMIRRYSHIPDIFTFRGGSTFRLPNGNTLVNWGNKSPSLTEYHPDGTVAVEFDFSKCGYSRQVFKYNWQPRVFTPSPDTVNFGMWSGSDTLTRHITLHNHLPDSLPINGYTVHNSSFFLMDSLPVTLPGNGEATLTVGFYPVAAQWGYQKDVMTIYSDDSIRRVGRQIWLFGQKEDHTPPEVTIMPDSNNVSLNPRITVDFSEPVRRTDDRELDYAMVDTLIIFRENGPSGPDVPFNANVNTDKDHILIVPCQMLKGDQIYYISYKNELEDYMDNAVPVKEVYFATKIIMTVKNNRELHNIMVFPNPAGRTVTIRTSVDEPWKVQIYSILGTLMMEKDPVTVPEIVLDLHEFHRGVYIVVITSKQGKTKKVKLIVE